MRSPRVVYTRSWEDLGPLLEHAIPLSGHQATAVAGSAAESRPSDQLGQREFGVDKPCVPDEQPHSIQPVASAGIASQAMGVLMSAG